MPRKFFRVKKNKTIEIWIYRKGERGPEIINIWTHIKEYFSLLNFLISFFNKYKILLFNVLSRCTQMASSKNLNILFTPSQSESRIFFIWVVLEHLLLTCIGESVLQNGITHLVRCWKERGLLYLIPHPYYEYSWNKLLSDLSTKETIVNLKMPCICHC